MSVVNLQIDELLKLRLTALMEEFQNNRVSETITIKEKINTDEIAVKAVIEEAKKEKKEESFFHKFFFSEY